MLTVLARTSTTRFVVCGLLYPVLTLSAGPHLVEDRKSVV